MKKIIGLMGIVFALNYPTMQTLADDGPPPSYPVTVNFTITSPTSPEHSTFVDESTVHARVYGITPDGKSFPLGDAYYYVVYPGVFTITGTKKVSISAPLDLVVIADGYATDGTHVRGYVLGNSKRVHVNPNPSGSSVTLDVPLLWH